MADDQPHVLSPDVLTDAAAATVPLPRMPTYHIALWDEPAPRYVCLLCPHPAPHLTLDEVRQHVPAVHEQDAVPTETIPHMLSIRAMAEAEAAAQAAPAEPPDTPTSTSSDTPIPEEVPDARGPDANVP